MIALLQRHRWNISPLRDRDGRVVGASTIARDITVRVEAEQAISANVEQQARIIVAQQNIANAGQNLNAMMQSAVEHCRRLTGADGAIVELVEGDETVFEAVAGIAAPLLGMRLRQDNTLSGLLEKVRQALNA